jgi:hypothetical protein
MRWSITSLAMMALMGAAEPALAQQLTVQANERKYNGQVWDGAELYAPLALPSSTPPDLAVCLAPLTEPEQCQERGEGRQRKSPCPNSHSCTFTLAANSREPYGLFIYDIDLRLDDLVDVVIVVPGASWPAERTRAIETRLRALMESRAPAFTPMEKDRRARDIFVVTADQCRESCTLTQSQIRLQ